MVKRLNVQASGQTRHPGYMTATPKVTVVIATRNRRAELAVTLGRLKSLPERPRIFVMDNGSVDDTVRSITAEFPSVVVIPLGRDQGPVARTIGVVHATTDLVAFCDDDAWWAPGSLRQAGQAFERHPDLGLVAATVLVGDDHRLDPVTRAMRRSPLPRHGLPGPAVLGFGACGAVVRRSAFLSVGGFQQARFGGEEELLAIDLAEAGWRLSHVPSVVVHHHPSRRRDPSARAAAVVENDLRTALIRLPWHEVAARLPPHLRSATREPAARRALGRVVRETPGLLQQRRPVSKRTARQVARLRRTDSP